ncbi:hypothetical protein [Sphingomonas endolithica]|uniref:hypothetical protein n=1 Tax=Sphingomonas endolithica TaxID=2972485 RepID=UPI0021B0781B|nr:hypothetical protein [Sphingomonas sp. ZFBP2030]
MILLTMLLAAQAAPPPAALNDIVVVGQRMERLKRLRMTTKRDRATGVTRCIFKRRSGDPTLDAAVCDAVIACVPKVKTVDEMRSCVAPTMDALVAKGVPWQAGPTRDR